ncbi:hypothetical protein MC885_000301 [Smutsia gigantea]|nr:hypothetical protein MC885_000301 [Smutsia gigantea]
MACGLRDLQGLASPFASAKLENHFYIEDRAPPAMCLCKQGEPWFRGTCGQTNISCKTVQGKLVEVCKWPWQVSTLFLGVYMCSGSLIHRQGTLTAARCLQRSKDPEMYTVRVGVQRLPENSTQLMLTRVVIHKDFNNLISHDIALLQLREPISWSPPPRPSSLPTQHQTQAIDWNHLLGDGGWGTHRFSRWHKGHVTPKPPRSLQEVAVKILNNDICNHQYQFLFLKGQKSFIGNDMLCANSQWGVDTCQVRSVCTG